MSSGLAIQYLPHTAIDKQRWDKALGECANARIYAQSVYLDHMCPGWDALITEDYQCLFPLPWRKKGGIRYLFQPFLTAQLGLFAPHPDRHLLNLFLAAIPKVFRYLDLPLNGGNFFDGTNGHQQLYARNNFVLDLSSAYSELYPSFRENIRRNIRKAQQQGCRVEQQIPLAAIQELAANHATDRKGMAAFALLYEKLLQQQQASTWGIRSAQGQLLASAVFLFDRSRAYYLLVGNHPNGRTLGASHLLIDRFIEAHAGSGLLLDFEGSDFRNLAFFYQSFGAIPEPYPALRINRLPWWAQWAK